MTSYSEHIGLGEHRLAELQGGARAPGGRGQGPGGWSQGPGRLPEVWADGSTP